MYLAACVQIQGSSNIERNLRVSAALIRQAAAAGAQLVVTPEATTYLGPHSRKIELAEPTDGPTHRYFGELAKELGIHLLLGSGAEPADDKRCYNTSMLFGPDGVLIASYRKMHLFDVEVPGGVSFRESDTCAPGDEVVVAETPLGNIGMSICYDLRFPELFRAQNDAGATLFTVPSAFTLMTGKDHWHALLRARAIENQGYVLAAGQWGEHDDAGLRRSYGHSVIIDPWGTVIAECSDGEGICLAVIDPAKVAETRKAIPLGLHRRV